MTGAGSQLHPSQYEIRAAEGGGRREVALGLVFLLALLPALALLPYYFRVNSDVASAAAAAGYNNRAAYTAAVIISLACAAAFALAGRRRWIQLTTPESAVAPP